jgi:hypothetical protein
MGRRIHHGTQDPPVCQHGRRATLRLAATDHMVKYSVQGWQDGDKIEASGSASEPIGVMWYRGMLDLLCEHTI